MRAMATIDRMRRNGRRRYIENYEFPTPLIAKLRSELGDRRKAEIALDGLRGWYLACLYADGRMIGMPSQAVDKAWHEMILMTREYTSFCQRAFGRYLHHSPDSTLKVSMDDLLQDTLAIVDEHDLPMRLFTADSDADIEDGSYWAATDLRRMRDAIAAGKDKRRRRRRSGWAAGESGAAGFLWFGDGGSSDGGGSDGGGGGGGCGGGGCGGGG
jgi:hypothetical protein